MGGGRLRIVDQCLDFYRLTIEQTTTTLRQRDEEKGKEKENKSNEESTFQKTNISRDSDYDRI